MPEMPKNVKDALEAYGTRCVARGGLRLIDMATDPGTWVERSALEAAIVAYAEEARREGMAWALEWSAYTVDMIVTCHNAATRDVGARAAQAIRNGLPGRPSPSPVEGDGARGKMKVTVLRGPGATHSLYVNDVRVAGSKPWGGGTVVAEWSVDPADLRVPPPEPAPSEPESGGAATSEATEALLRIYERALAEIATARCRPGKLKDMALDALKVGQAARLEER